MISVNLTTISFKIEYIETSAKLSFIEKIWLI